jgi:hypothetical protein
MLRSLKNWRYKMGCPNCGVYCGCNSIFCNPPIEIDMAKAEKRVAAVKWCAYADEPYFDCPHIGVEETCQRKGKVCPIDDERYEPYPIGKKGDDSKDPWLDTEEKTPTHMNF